MRYQTLCGFSIISGAVSIVKGSSTDMKSSPPLEILFCLLSVLTLLLCHPLETRAQAKVMRTLSGVIVNQKGEAVPGVSLTVRCAASEQKVVGDAEGNFRLLVPAETLTLKIEGKYV